MSTGGMKIQDFTQMEVRNGRLYWKGEEVVTKQRLSLRAYELGLATVGVLAALTGAVWPILVHFTLV